MSQSPSPPRSTRPPPGWLERVAMLPDRIWSPIAALTLLLAVGLLAYLCDQPWLFPSLGPTVYVIAERPGYASARPRNTLLGHAAGIACGYLSLALFPLSGTPGPHHLALARAFASALAVGMTTLLNLRLRASQPAANSTALLVALGEFHTASDALALGAGVLLVTLLGEPLRRLRLETRPETRPPEESAAESRRPASVPTRAPTR